MYTENTDFVVYNPEPRLKGKPKPRQDETRSNENSEKSSTEKSYEPVFTYERTLASVMYLNFNIRWISTTILANVTLFVILSYCMSFDPDVDNELLILVLKFFCTVILCIDTVAMLFNYLKKDYQKFMPYDRVSGAHVITQCLSLLGLMPRYVFMQYDSYVTMVTHIMRFYKLKIYSDLLFYLPGYNTLRNLAGKYLVVLVVVSHSLACVWMYIGCTETVEECRKMYSGPYSFWRDGSLSRMFKMGRNTTREPSSFQYYVICKYYVTGGLTSVGFGGASERNDLETFIALVTLCLFLLIFYGSFIVDFVNWQMETMISNKLMTERIEKMRYDLSNHPHVPAALSRRILKYYYDFRQADSAVKRAKMLRVLPRSIYNEIKLEEYWYFVLKCEILNHADEAFKRAIALQIHCEAYNKGDVLYDLGQTAEVMYYVARGSIQVLSGDDGESPIVTLGPGSCIGQMYMLYSFKTRMKVTVPNYTTVYSLRKDKFWKTVSRLRKLKSGPLLHTIFQAKVEATKNRLSLEEKIDRRFERKWKCTESKKILSDFKGRINAEMLAINESVDVHEDINDLMTNQLYILSVRHNQRAYDEIFFRTQWPWVLHPHSQIHQIWDIFLFIILIYVAIRYPYIIAFHQSAAIPTLMCNDLIFFAFTFDIALQIFTAIETKSDVHWRISEVLWKRLEMLTFTIDLIAAVPFHFILIFFGNNKRAGRLVSILVYNRLLKLYKVHQIFSNLEHHWLGHIRIIKPVKYSVYISYFAYIAGSIYIMISCSERGVCSEDSWISTLRRFISELPGYEKQYDPTDTLLLYSFLQELYVVTTTGAFLVVHISEVETVVLFAISGAIVFSYLVSEFTGSVTMESGNILRYGEFINACKKFMDDMDMPKCLQDRVAYNFRARWAFNHGIEEENLYHDCPKHLYELQQIAKFQTYIKDAPLFKYLSDEIINVIASRCTEIHLPPEEYVIYSGTAARDVYIITKGHCVVIEANLPKQLLGPKSLLSGIETVMGVRHVLTIRAQTFVRLIKLNYNDLEWVLRRHPDVKQQILRCMDKMTLLRIFTSFEDFYVPKWINIQDQNRSWFVFRRNLRDALNMDYKTVYRQSQWYLARYLLMRRTILPDGRFLLGWEIFRAICAFLTGMLAPSCIIYQHYFEPVKYIIWSLFTCALIDIYIRCHVCYYNENGILVTHPLYTTKHYLTHAFVMDLIAMLPMSSFTEQFESRRNSKILFLMDFNVLIQMYRFPEVIVNYSRKNYGKNSVLLQAVKCTPIALIVCNTMACLLTHLSSDIVDGDGGYHMAVKNFSWITTKAHKFSFDVKELCNFFFTAFFCTLSYLFGIGFNQFHPVTQPEVYYFIACLATGYILKAYILVSVVHSRFLTDQKLSMYQNYMSQLVNYMRKEKLSKTTQMKVINYFEHMWRITTGVKTQEFLEKCHKPLKVDCILAIYGSTLRSVTVFEDLSIHFYRRVAIYSKSMHLLKGAPFIRLNDIVDTVYIIHRGVVLVHDPTGKLITALENGSMFGNIDNVSCTRSLVSYTMNSLTDLICLKTPDLYKILQEYPVTFEKLERHITMENLSYVPKTVTLVDERHEDMDNDRHGIENPYIRITATKYFFLFMVFVSLASCVIASYQFAFYCNDLIADIFLYFFDAMYVLKVVIHLYMPYYDNKGDLVTDRKLIRKRYMKISKFYFDCLTLFPFEIFCLLASSDDRQKYRRVLASYRILRACNVYRYFNVSYNLLYANHILVRLASITTNFILFLHLGACVLYFYACPFQNCSKGTWVYTSHGRKRCANPYLCSLYYMMSMFTGTGFAGIKPNSRFDMLFCMIIILLSTFIVGAYIGDVCTLFRNHTLSRIKYDFEVTVLKVLKSCTKGGVRPTGNALISTERKDHILRVVFMGLHKNVRSTLLRNRFVSPGFLAKIVKYCEYLWVTSNGQQVPTLLLEAPKYLVGKVKIEAYGRHIYENEVFMKCHPDFLRAIIRSLKVQTFFVGNTICQKEDINDTMFFIHKGIVDVYSIIENEEIHVDELQELDSFGHVQGIYAQTPHTHTYRANAVCIILMLHYEDWNILLRFFPASKYELYRILSIEG